MPLTIDEVRAAVIAERAHGAPLAGLELREPRGEKATGDGSLTFSGRAVVYGQRTVLGEIPGVVRITEEITPGALSDILEAEPDVHFNVGHDMNRAMARVVYGDEIPIGGMALRESLEGLDVFARLDPEDPDVAGVATKMRRGVIDEMSFKFRIGEERLEEREDDDGTLVLDYTIDRVSDLIDVCVCARGAYSMTTAELRSIVSPERPVASFRNRHVDEAGGLESHSPEEGIESDHEAPASGGGYVRARIAAARIKYPRLP